MTHDQFGGSQQSHLLSRRSLLRGVAIGGAAIGAGALLSACTSSDPGPTGSTGTSGASASPKRGGKARIGFADGGPDETLNPLSLPTFIGLARTQSLYDRLYQTDPNLVSQPRLAESAEGSADATVWRVKLKSGVTWHDGKPFTADDVLWTVAWIQDPKSASEAASVLAPIDIAKSRKVSDTEIEFVLKQPYGDFKSLLAQKAFLIVPNGQKTFTPDNVNGTGPYKLSKFAAGSVTILDRNDDYFGGSPYLDQLEFRTIAESNARLNALTGGEIDALAFLDFTQARASKDDPSIQLVIATGATNVPITMRLDSAPFTDPRVRQAFRLAVDRQALVDNVLQGFGKVANDLHGFGYPSYNSDLPQRTYDPEKAKGLLKAAGAENVSVTLYTSKTVSGMQESATVFKEQAKSSGIDVQLKVLDASSYFANDLYLKAPFYQSAWGNSFEDQAVQGLLSDSPYNETGWNKPDWEKKFRAAQSIADDTARNAAYKDLQVDLYDEGGYVLWGTQQLVDAASPTLRGITPNPLFPLGYFEAKDWWYES
jgi:peptide/nickel transport system substrate-binding protein